MLEMVFALKNDWTEILDLAEGISEFYYCVGLVNRYSKTVTFVGRPDNVESLKLLYNWIIEQVKKIAAVERRKHYDSSGEHIDPLRWQVSFGEGVVERLIDRLREMKARQVEDEVMSHDMFGNVTSLILHHQAEVSDFLEQKYGYRKDGRLTKAQQERRAQWDKEREEEERARAAEERRRGNEEESARSAAVRELEERERRVTLAEHRVAGTPTG